MQQPRPGMMVLDGILGDDDLEWLSAVVASLNFEDQEIGRGVLASRQRALSGDPAIASLLWSRLEPVLPPVSTWLDSVTRRLDPPLEFWRAVGCNPRTRFYRYRVGASFSMHEDEPWRPNSHTRSLLTVLAYLPCGGCDGGETVIDGEVVQPIDGRVVVFDHALAHEGRPVERGSKIVLRSDVIARATDGWNKL